MTLMTYFNRSLFIIFFIACAKLSFAHGIDHHAEGAEHLVHKPDASIRELIQRYSLTGEDKYIEQGWKILNRDDEQRESINHYLHAAWLAQAQHEFSRANDYLDKAIILAPTHSQAWLLKAAVLQVQGKIDAARKACTQVAAHMHMSVGLFCKARLDIANAKLAQARLIQLQALVPLSSNEELNAWAMSILGELAQTAGDLESARKYFHQAFTLKPSIQYRSAYIDLLIATGDYQKALALAYKERSPAIAVRRLLIENGLGKSNKKEIMRVHHLFQHWIDEGDMKHAREMALFYSDLKKDLPLAHALAKKNLVFQKEPEDHKLLANIQAKIKRSHL